MAICLSKMFVVIGSPSKEESFRYQQFSSLPATTIISDKRVEKTKVA